MIYCLLSVLSVIYYLLFIIYYPYLNLYLIYILYNMYRTYIEFNHLEPSIFIYRPTIYPDIWLEDLGRSMAQLGKSRTIPMFLTSFLVNQSLSWSWLNLGWCLLTSHFRFFAVEHPMFCFFFGVKQSALFADLQRWDVQCDLLFIDLAFAGVRPRMLSEASCFDGWGDEGQPPTIVRVK